MAEKTYSEIWKGTEPAMIAGRYAFGSKGVSKMKTFLMSHPLDNKTIREILNVDPMKEGDRTTDVGRKLVRNMQDFQKALVKYREYTFKYPNRVPINNKTKLNESKLSKPKNRKERRLHLQPIRD